MRPCASGIRRRPLLVAAVAIAAPFAGAETLWLDVLGGSAGVLDGAPGRAAGAVAFADMDADGEEEVVAVEARMGGRSLATISRWSPAGRLVERVERVAWAGWRDSELRMLVGNLAGDATPELVLFTPTPFSSQDPIRTRIVRWVEGDYATADFASGGRVAALADFNGDAVAELVFAVPAWPGAPPADPVALCVYAFTGDELKPTRRLLLENGVAALAAGDFDGDGRDELVAVSAGRGQLSVYGASGSGLELRSHWRRALVDIAFLAVFKSGGKSYLYAERGALRWRAVLRLVPDGEGAFALETVRGAERLALLADAFKATAAYSAERQTHYRFVGEDRLEPW